jgi:hypothetical protein
MIKDFFTALRVAAREFRSAWRNLRFIMELTK